MPVSEKEEDGTALALAVVVIRKPSGILLAVPQDYFPADALEDGHLAGPHCWRRSSSNYGRLTTRPRRWIGDRTGACGRTCRWTSWIISLWFRSFQVPQIFCTCSWRTRSSIHWRRTFCLRLGTGLHSQKEEIGCTITQPRRFPTARRSDSRSTCRRSPGFHSAWSKESRYFYLKRREVKGIESAAKGEEADYCSAGYFIGKHLDYPPGLDPADGGSLSEDEGHGEFSSRPKIVSLEQAIWRIMYSWIKGCLEGFPSCTVEGDASTSSCFKDEAASFGSSCGRRGCFGVDFRAGEGRRPVRHVQSHVCPVFSCYCTGCSDCKFWRVDMWRPSFRDFRALQQGCYWPDEVATGVGSAQGHLFQRSDGQHESTDEPGISSGQHAFGAEEQRCDYDKVRRKVRRVWEGPGDGFCHVAGCNDNGLLAVGELVGGKGCNSSFVRMPGANGNGFINGCGSVAGFGGRSPLGALYRSEPGSPVTGPFVCSACRSTLGCKCSEFHQGAGSYYSEKGRCFQQQGRQLNGSFGCCTEDEAEAPAKGDLEKEAEANRRWVGSLVDKLGSSGGASGEGVCQTDRCCPDLAALQVQLVRDFWQGQKT